MTLTPLGIARSTVQPLVKPPGSMNSPFPAPPAMLFAGAEESVTISKPLSQQLQQLEVPGIPSRASKAQQALMKSDGDALQKIKDLGPTLQAVFAAVKAEAAQKPEAQRSQPIQELTRQVEGMKAQVLTHALQLMEHAAPGLEGLLDNARLAQEAREKAQALRAYVETTRSAVNELRAAIDTSKGSSSELVQWKAYLKTAEQALKEGASLKKQAQDIVADQSENDEDRPSLPVVKQAADLIALMFDQESKGLLHDSQQPRQQFESVKSAALAALNADSDALDRELKTELRRLYQQEHGFACASNRDRDDVSESAPVYLPEYAMEQVFKLMDKQAEAVDRVAAQVIAREEALQAAKQLTQKTVLDARQAVESARQAGEQEKLSNAEQALATLYENNFNQGFPAYLQALAMPSETPRLTVEERHQGLRVPLDADIAQSLFVGNNPPMPLDIRVDLERAGHLRMNAKEEGYQVSPWLKLVLLSVYEEVVGPHRSRGLERTIDLEAFENDRPEIFMNPDVLVRFTKALSTPGPVPHNRGELWLARQLDNLIQEQRLTEIPKDSQGKHVLSIREV